MFRVFSRGRLSDNKCTLLHPMTYSNLSANLQKYPVLRQLLSTFSRKTAFFAGLPAPSLTCLQLMSKQCCQQAHALSTSSSSSRQPLVEETDDVLFETIEGKGVITLNRPRALHSLNLSMTRKILPVLRQWEGTQSLVIIKSSGGKAFCAGGDVRAVTESATAGTSVYRDFFRSEYELNGLIGTLQIPYIALIDGITMGGGVGLSVHGKYRVATERTLFAMPETRIGLFPDVGGSYFLPRLGGKLGLYLALTGERLKGGDVVKAGIATHACDLSKLAALEQDLLGLNPKNSNMEKDIDTVLRKYESQCSFLRHPFSLESKLSKIEQLFSGKSVEEIRSRLEEESKSGSEPEWAQRTLDTLSQMSPTSMKVTLRLLELGESLDLQEALQVEYRLSQRCCEKHDFIEGVRALLIDKDNRPVWNPSRLEDVTQEMVDSHFAPLSDATQELQI